MSSIVDTVTQERESSSESAFADYRRLLMKDVRGEATEADAKQLREAIAELDLDAERVRSDRDIMREAVSAVGRATRSIAATAAMKESSDALARFDAETERINADRQRQREELAAKHRATTLQFRRESGARWELDAMKRKHPQLLADLEQPSGAGATVAPAPGRAFPDDIAEQVHPTPRPQGIVKGERPLD